MLTADLRMDGPVASRVRDALTPREWARAGAMALSIIGLNVLGWGMLAAATGRRDLRPDHHPGHRRARVVSGSARRPPACPGTG